jgi:carbamate kinase
VPSPRPTGFVEAEPIRLLAGSGHVLVAAGGGGVPVVPEPGGGFRGVEAVVDKDRAAAALGLLVGAEVLAILTEVPQVQLGFGTPAARSVPKLSVSEARGLLAAGEFPAGSMGPKVEACCEFRVGRRGRAVIGALEQATDVVLGTAGTTIVAGLSGLTGAYGCQSAAAITSAWRGKTFPVRTRCTSSSRSRHRSSSTVSR